MTAIHDELARIHNTISTLTQFLADSRNDIGVLRSISDAATTAANAQAIGLSATRDRLRQLEMSVSSKAGRCQQRHHAVHKTGTSALDDVESTARNMADNLLRLEKRIDALTINTMRSMDGHDRDLLPKDPDNLDRLDTELTEDAAQTVIDPARDDTTRSSGPRPSTPAEQVSVG